MKLHHIKNKLAYLTPETSEWKGAVLFLCNDDHVFLVKRSLTMPTHPGEIAFIGGHKKESESAPWEVVQREFQEETNLDPKHLEFLGTLNFVNTARKQPIVPVMARLQQSTDQFLRSAQTNGEWVELMAYPWDQLIQETRWQYAWWHGQNQRAVMFHPIEAETYLAQTANSSSHLLWGATARMIWDFLRLYFKE